MTAGDGRFSHEVMAYVSSNGCTFGLEVDIHTTVWEMWTGEVCSM